MMETEGRTLVQGLLETQVIEELRRQTEVGRSPNSRKPPPPEGHKEEWHHQCPQQKQEHGRPVSHLLEPQRRLSHHGEARETKSKETSPPPILPSPPGASRWLKELEQTDSVESDLCIIESNRRGSR